MTNKLPDKLYLGPESNYKEADMPLDALAREWMSREDEDKNAFGASIKLKRGPKQATLATKQITDQLRSNAGAPQNAMPP
jgi:hypothetical protein